MSNTLKHLALLILALLLSSCFKNSGKVDNSQPVFNITTYSFSIYDSSTIPFPFNLKFYSGNTILFPIKLSLSGLPFGVSCSPDTLLYQPNNNVTFLLSAENAAYGTDTIVLHVNSTTYGAQQYTTNMQVSAPYDCSRERVGTLQSNDPCGHFAYGIVWSGNYTARIDTLPGIRHWVTLTNFRGLGDSVVVKAYIQCNNYPTIVIPWQTVQGYTISGTGSYEDEIFIYDTIIHAGDTQTCISQLE